MTFFYRFYVYIVILCALYYYVHKRLADYVSHCRHWNWINVCLHNNIMMNDKFKFHTAMPLPGHHNTNYTTTPTTHTAFPTSNSPLRSCVCVTMANNLAMYVTYRRVSHDCIVMSSLLTCCKLASTSRKRNDAPVSPLCACDHHPHHYSTTKAYRVATGYTLHSPQYNIIIAYGFCSLNDREIFTIINLFWLLIAPLPRPNNDFITCVTIYYTVYRHTSDSRLSDKKPTFCS